MPKITGSLNKDTIANIDCPRCKATAGNQCQQPNGDINYKGPHQDRIKAYKDKIGTDEYARYYTIIGRRKELGLPTYM